MSGGWPAAFDAMAPGYDEHTRGGGWQPNQVAAALLEPLALRPGRVLDLGAGTGQTTEELARSFPDADFTLVDPSRGMLDVARAKLPGATVVQADAAHFLASTSDTWDLVAAIGVLELVPDLFEVLRLAADRLAPGGHLVVTHEPLMGTSVQARSTSSLSDGRLVQRHTSEDVERRTASYGLRRVAAQELVAFDRSDGDGTATYELVVWALA